MKKLAEALEFFGCVPDQRILWSFELYMRRVLEWNEHVNLTAIRDRDDFIEKHFIDSLCCLSDDRWKSAQTVVDVGTGAGFPGIPLAIVSPEKEFLLIDSLNKRIRIINELIGELGLRNVRAVHGRAEEMARQKQYRQKFGLCFQSGIQDVGSFGILSAFLAQGRMAYRLQGTGCGEGIERGSKCSEHSGRPAG